MVEGGPGGSARLERRRGPAQTKRRDLAGGGALLFQEKSLLESKLIRRTFSSSGLPESATKLASYPSRRAPIFRFGKIVSAVVSGPHLQQAKCRTRRTLQLLDLLDGTVRHIVTAYRQADTVLVESFKLAPSAWRTCVSARRGSTRPEELAPHWTQFRTVRIQGPRIKDLRDLFVTRFRTPVEVRTNLCDRDSRVTQRERGAASGPQSVAAGTPCSPSVTSRSRRGRPAVDETGRDREQEPSSSPPALAPTASARRGRRCPPRVKIRLPEFVSDVLVERETLPS